MALAGSLILLYAAYSYVSQKQLEAKLTAEIPGQNSNNNSAATPIVLVPSAVTPSGPTIALPTIDSSSTSPSVTPFPAHTTPVQPDETSAVHVAGTATAVSIAPRTALPTVTPPTSSPTGAAGSAPTLDPVTSKPIGVPRGTGAPATHLQIPKLNLDTSIIEANYATFQQNGQLISDWEVPYDAAGHLSTTAEPGEIGNAILSGHHNLTAPNTFGLGLFAGLWNLVTGDEIRITLQNGKNQVWRVTDSFPVKEAGEPLSVRIEHAQQIMGDTPDATLTLLTCWNGKSNPLSGNTYRWVIHAELVNVN